MNMIKEDLVYELVIGDESDEVYAVSLVNSPAIELGWVAFDKEEVKFQKIDEEKQLVLGPILIPNKRILRVDGEGNTYHVFLKEQTIEQLAQKYLKNKYTDAVTVEHEERVDDVVLVESWLVESTTKDKSALYGFAVPKGTWMGVMKINSPEIWEDVKNGTYQGFSIEGLFSHQLVAAAKVELDLMNKEIAHLSEQEAAMLLKKIKALINKDKRYKSKKRVDMESFSDYPDSVKNAAKKALEWADKNGWGSCGTPVGKQRANQLAKGEPISVDTIKRMYSYVSRHEIDLQTSKTYSDGCGKLMMDSWGGLAAGRWAKSKLKELGLINEQSQPSIPGSSYAGEPAEDKKKLKGGDVPPVFQKFEEGNLDVFGLETEYFYMCPGAVELFTHLVSMPVDEDTKGMIRSAALIADRIFDIEEDVIENGMAEPADAGQVFQLVADFKDLIKEIDEITGMKHDVGFMDGHVKVVKDLL